MRPGNWSRHCYPRRVPGGRPRTTDMRAVVNAIFYLLRTGCQWRLLPREFPAWGTGYYYFRNWENLSVWTNRQKTSWTLILRARYTRIMHRHTPVQATSGSEADGRG